MSSATNWVIEYLGAVGVVFAAIMATAFVLFSVERALYKIYLMSKIRIRWFPQGRFILACTTGNERWDGYLEETLLPEIEDCAVIVEAAGIGLVAGFERELVTNFMEENGMVPEVVVFMPNFERRVIRFSEALTTPGVNGEMMLANAKTKLIELVESQRERMRVYI